VIRRPALVAAVAIVLSALAPAARAETWSHRDAVRDVVRVDVNAVDDQDVTAVPRDRSTDVRRITVAHRRDVIQIQLRVRDVTRGNQLAQAVVHAPGGRGGFVALVRVGGRDRVMADGFSPDRDQRCRGAHARVLPRADRVTLALPTDCLGDPEWVRVSASYGTFEGRPRTVEEVTLDDALSDTFDGLGGGRFSPRIHVG
jgi:hypothetical protein